MKIEKYLKILNHKNPYRVLFALTVMLVHSVFSQPQLTIAFTYKDNAKQLAQYANSAENVDHYKATVWVEGPYDPGTSCSIVEFHRQNINLVRILSYYQPPELTDLDESAWVYEDYATPDFIAALITSGHYYHLPDWTSSYADIVQAPADALRQDIFTGGPYLESGSVIYELDSSGEIYILGDIREVPDGISGATMVPGETETITWDMKDMNGDLVPEGDYLVYVQLSAERHNPADEPSPRKIAWNQKVGGLEAVNLETCWDDASYDTKGPHRAAGLFHFGSDAFNVSVDQEKKWSGDTYDYINGPVTFSYTGGQLGQSAISQVQDSKSTVLNAAVTSGGMVFALNSAASILKIYDLNGGLTASLLSGNGGESQSVWHWNGVNLSGEHAEDGMYIAIAESRVGQFSTKVFLAR